MSGCCKCKWAKWRKTPTGRNRRNHFGSCTFPIPELPKMPICVWMEPLKRIVIWWDNSQPDCPTFEPKEKP